MKKIYLCIIITLPIFAFAQAPCDQTNVTLNSQSDVDSFPSRGCSTVCFLTIQGNDITNLDSLYVLEKAGVVNISYNPMLTDIGGLNHLTTIAPTCTFGGLFVQGNNILTNLDGLSALTSVTGTTNITSNTMLDNINGLSNLTSVTTVIVQSNATLDNIDGFSGLTSIGGALTIKGNPALDELHGLSNVTTIAGDLDVEYMDGLLSLDGLQSLETVAGQVIFVWNTKLTSFRPLFNLHSIGQFSASGQSLLIGSNESLTSLDGLQGLDTIPGVLSIGDNDALQNLDGLSSLKSLKNPKGDSYNAGISISGNASLTSIAGLSQLQSITEGRAGYIDIYDNDALTTIDSLSLNLVGGYIGGRVKISYNDNLRNIDGFASLARITGGPGGAVLEITENPKLENIDALENLTKVSSANGGTVIIVNNVELGKFCGLYPLFHDKGIGCGSPQCYSTAQVTIDGNERNPTPEEIEAEGPCDQLATQPTNLTFTQVTSEGMRGRFSRAATFASGYLVLMKAYSPSAPEDVPQDGMTYRVGQVVGSSSIVVSAGMDTTFVVSGLEPSTPYYFDVFSWKVGDNGNDYLTVNPLERSQSTAAQAAMANNLSFTDITDESMTVMMDDAQPGNYIALMKAFGYPSPNDMPEDGTEYHVGNTIGSSTIVVNIGDGSAFSVNGLEPGVTYYFDVYKYDPSTFTYEPGPAQDSQATNAQAENLRAYPNPFDVSTTIPFVVSQDNAAVQVSIYDAMGREVNVLTSGNFEAGKHEASWDGYDSNGRRVTAGIYIFRVKSDTGMKTGRVSVR